MNIQYIRSHYSVHPILTKVWSVYFSKLSLSSVNFHSSEILGCYFVLHGFVVGLGAIGGFGATGKHNTITRILRTFVSLGLGLRKNGGGVLGRD